MSNAQTKPVIPVILAGGRGSRLWPMSSGETPKQFCGLDGTASFFQCTVKRVANRRVYEPPLVITSFDNHSTVTRQLKEVEGLDARVVLEPEGRDTAPAIVIAALLARASLPRGQEGYLLVLPSDHVLKRSSAFHKGVQAVLETSDSSKRLWAMGVPARHPETGYGYLQLGLPLGKSIYEVERFVEKPCESRAREFITSGKCVWNSGMFLFPISLLLEEIETYFPDMLSNCTRAATEGDVGPGFVRPAEMVWSALPSISIDHALMEKTGKAGVVLTDPDWSDLGNWKAWWDASAKDPDANALNGPVATHQCVNSLVQSDGAVVAALGIKNLAIVANGRSVLVAPLDRVGELKEMAGEIGSLSHLATKSVEFEERPWGRFDRLKKGRGFQVKIISVNPDGMLSLQYHHHRSEHWTVVQGVADVRVGSEKRQLRPNDSIYIPCEEIHRLSNTGKETVKIIEIQIGDYLGEDDIVRLDDTYGRCSPAEERSYVKHQAQLEIEFPQH